MPDPESSQRRVILVVGADSGPTRAVGGALAALGAADLGAGDAGRWVGDLHRDLLDRCGVEIDDARPAAWFETGKIIANGITRARLTEWLGQQFVYRAGDSAPDRVGQPRPDVVVADPVLSWLLGLWRAASLRCDAEVAQVLVLTPAPADPAAAAAWLNRMLHVERATRGGPRTLLSWADVVADWTVPFVALGHDLGLSSVQEATANQIRRAHEVVADAAEAPAWEVAAPTLLSDLVEATTAALFTGAADGRGSNEVDEDELDRLRGAYRDRYAAAEAITASSARAALRASPATPHDTAPPEALGDRAKRGVRRALGK